PGSRARQRRQSAQWSPPGSEMSLPPSTNELKVLGAPIELRDGSRVRVRQGHSSDRDLLLRGFARLSKESRYRRFLVPKRELSEANIHYLTEIDHHEIGRAHV